MSEPTTTLPPSVAQGGPIQEGQGNPNSLDSGAGPASSVEIGAIVGAIALVIILCIGGFYWRARKNKAAKDIEAFVAANHSNQPHPAGAPYGQPPFPPPKDENRGMSSGDIKAVPADPRSPKILRMKLGNRSGDRQHDGVEEHEIVNRL